MCVGRLVCVVSVLCVCVCVCRLMGVRCERWTCCYVQGPAPNAPMVGGKPKRPMVASALFNMMAYPHLNPNSSVPLSSIPSHIPRDHPPSPEPAAAAADRDGGASLMALTPVVRP